MHSRTLALGREAEALTRRDGGAALPSKRTTCPKVRGPDFLEPTIPRNRDKKDGFGEE